jgi:CHAT domain-containing protein
LLNFITSEALTVTTRDQAHKSVPFLFDEELFVQPRRVHLRFDDQVLNREIGRGETQNFNIQLDAGQFTQVFFYWQSINLNVAILDPSGKRLPSDIQVTAPGPVVVCILAERAGVYKLEITTPVRQKVTGKYGLILEEPHLPSVAERNRSAAQTEIAEGQNALTPSSRIEKYNHALTLFQEIDTNGAARVHMLLGDVYKAGRDLLSAKANYEKAAALWNTSNYIKGEAYAKLSLGLLHRSLASGQEAIPYYEQARLLFSQISDRRGQADALYGHAFTLMLMGQTPEAIALLQPALEFRRTDGDRMGEASILNMMADAYRLLGDFDKCIGLYDQATASLRGLEHPSLEASLINGRALVYDDQGFWQDAKAEYARSLSVYESMLGQPLMNACGELSVSENSSICRSAAVVLINLGEAYSSLGQPENALHEFQRSLNISDALGQPVAQGAARFHIGYAHSLLGDPTTALNFYQKALEFQQKAGDEKGKSLTYTYLGMLYTALNEPRVALGFYQKALPIQQASGDKRSLAITLDKLATGYRQVGEANEASINYAKALDLWRAIKDPDGEALTLYNMATTESLAGNLPLANQHAEAALKLVESLRTRLTSQTMRTSYLAFKEDYYQINTDLKMQLGLAGKPNEHVATALESSEKAKARVLLDTLSEAGVGRVEFNQATDRNLAKLLDQRLVFLRKLGAKAQARTRLLSERPTPEQSANIQKQVTSIDDEINRLAESYDQIETQLRSMSPRLANLTKPQPSTLAEIQQQLDANTLLLEYALGEKRSYVWVVSPDSIDGFELPARAEIESVARRVTETLTARNREVKDERLQQKRTRLDKAEAEYAEASATLSKLILQPVAPLRGQKRLVIVADGALQLIPFASLPVPVRAPDAAKLTSNAQTNATTALRVRALLIDSHEIVSLPSASVLALQRRELSSRKPAPYDVAVIADPVFDDQDERVARAKGNLNQQRQDAAIPKPGIKDSAKENPLNSPATDNKTHNLASALRDVGLDPGRPLPRLTFSRQEARGITRAISSNQSLSALDFKANRETATSPELSKYRIVHFATHGVLDLEHPELSGIALSMVDEKGQPRDGYLRLHEIYNLNLPAELVVLSACQTGVGKQIKGEGLIALTRGFMYAGAKSVVASLWKVDDAATASLMTEFYRQMFTNKLKPAAALRAAQLKISQEKRWQSPYYWAGFFLQGEWN